MVVSPFAQRPHAAQGTYWQTETPPTAGRLDRLPGPARRLEGKALKGMATAMNSRLFTFVGGGQGEWSVVGVEAIVGDPLPTVGRVDIIHGAVPSLPEGAKWALRGVTSNERY